MVSRARGGRQETITENNHDAADKRGARENRAKIWKCLSVPPLSFAFYDLDAGDKRAGYLVKKKKKPRIRRDDTERRRGRYELH